MGRRNAVFRSRSVNRRQRLVRNRAPGVPTGLTSTAIRSTEADLTWSAPPDDQGVLFYEVVVTSP